MKCSILVLSLFLLFGCVTKKASKAENSSVKTSLFVDESYSTKLPLEDPNKVFEQAQRAVKRIQTTVYYTTYFFAPDQRITKQILQFQKADRLSVEKIEFNNSKTGSAIKLSKTNKHVLYMTCEHVVNAQDTVFVFKEGQKETNTSPLKSISILKKVEYLVFDTPQLMEFQVLSTNKEHDLALIVSDELPENFTRYDVLPLALGHEDNLRWGSIIYSIGYPLGYKMISQGLASITEKSSVFYMVSDVHFNPGISGGLIMALKKNTQTFEWVGVASSSSSTVEYKLVPKYNFLTSEQEDVQIYSDTIYVEKKTGINYGITRSIKASLIREFINNSRKEWTPYGFDLNSFYTKDSE